MTKGTQCLIFMAGWTAALGAIMVFSDHMHKKRDFYTQKGRKI